MAKLTFKQQLEGFPKWQVFVFCVTRLGEPIAFTSLFPYLYFLIRDFDIAKDNNEIATYSGYLAASFAFFQFLLAIKWGQVSDRIGRKKALMIANCASFTSLILFAFAKSYWFALLARSIMGMSNGVNSVLRTTIAELAPEARHHALAFTSLPLVWNIGVSIGPVIGGSNWLTRPKSEVTPLDLDSTYNKFMDAYPYALVNLVVASIILFSLLVMFLFFAEPQEERKHVRDRGIEIGDYLIRKAGYEPPLREWQVAAPEETTRLVDSEAEVRSVKTDNTPYREIFPPFVIKAIFSNFLFSAHSVIYSEFLPILLAGDLNPEGLVFPGTVASGFGFTTTEIGSLLSITGIVGGLSVIFVFPYADYHFSTLTVFRATTLVFPLVYATLPYLIFTLPEYNPNLPANFTRIGLYIICGLTSLAGSVGFSALLVLLNRSTPPKHRSIINGSLMSLASLARFLGPVVWGYVTTFGQKMQKAQLPWLILAFICFGLTAQAFSFSDNTEIDEIEGPQEEDEEGQAEEESVELLEEISTQYSSLRRN